MKRFYTILTLLTMLCLLAVPALAAGETADVPQAVAEVEEDSEENRMKSQKVWTAAILIGIACLGGALGMAGTIAKAASNIAEKPEAAGQIRTSMMMGLVFIETAIIYALIMAILIVFVL